MAILTERATGLTEILDGNVEAFQRLRAVGSDVTLAGAQQLVVDTIERMERATRGHVAVADALLRVAQEQVVADRPIRILEIASGSGWLLTNLHRRARRRGIEIELTGSDLNSDLVESMQRRLAHHRVPASTRVFDASDMTEVPDAAYDAAFMMFTLHHLRGDDNVRVLRELDRVSRGGMVVVDATRSLLALLAVPTLATLLAPRGGLRALDHQLPPRPQRQHNRRTQPHGAQRHRPLDDVRCHRVPHRRPSHPTHPAPPDCASTSLGRSHREPGKGRRP